MNISYRKLWHLLIDKKINKTILQKRAGISWSAISKMSKDKNVSTDVLCKICEALKCDISDIIEITDTTQNEESISTICDKTIT